jgi:hypothetical protein
MAVKLKPCTSPKGKHSWELLRNFERRNVTMNSRGTTMQVTFKGLYRCTACMERKEGCTGWPEEVAAAEERAAARRAAKAVEEGA